MCSQIDYLCELPNDAARRKALKNLPRGLKPTYERILRQVKESNEDAQKLVQRTLKWIAHDKSYGMTTGELCEAISINDGDKHRNLEAVPDEREILRNCRSLVRLSVDGRRIEFAHFTVEEFLKNLDDSRDGEFAAYHIGSNHIETELCKTCLTYLNLVDFDKGGEASEQITTDRFGQYAFREYAVTLWLEHAHVSDWNDRQLLSLATELFHPSKPNTLISWVQDRILHIFRYSHTPKEILATFNCGITEATALHYAAMCRLFDVCQWLIENGCDVNRRSAFGTPLHCAQLSFRAILGSFDYMMLRLRIGRYVETTVKELETIDILLNAGADPNIDYHSFSGALSPLFLAVLDDDLVTTQRLLQKGAMADDRFVNLLIEHARKDKSGNHLQNILENAQKIPLGEENRARLLQYALRAQIPCTTRLFPSSARSDDGKKDRNRQHEISLRTAAEYGQVNLVLRLLDDHGVDADAVEENTFYTALHYASMNDQLEVAQVLLERGASPSKADRLGKTALHYCVEKRRYRCLSFFLKQGLDVTVTDNEHLTVWHLAALQGNIEALKILLNNVASGKRFHEPKGRKERPLISCASRSGFAEAVSILLEAGYSVFDLDFDGCTALHHGARAGSPEVVRLLIAQGLDASAKTDDGSSTVHYAVMGNGAGLDVTLDVLLDEGVNPFIGRHDGTTPMLLLIGHGTEDASDLADDGTDGTSDISDGTDSANDSVRAKALRRLAGLPISFQGKQEDLKRALNVTCQLPASQHSTWLLTAFKTLLENGADLMSRSTQGQTALDCLLAVWQGQCSKLDSAFSPIFTLSRMVLAALEHVPSEGPLHEICAKPGLLLSAIQISDDELASKLLHHSPDVDKIIGNSNTSLIRAACQIGCDPILLRELLDRSKALSDNALGSELVREACQQGEEENHEALLELLEAGLDPNAPSARGETALMFAARGGNIDMVESLLSHGSDAKATDHAGRTVAHYACTSGHLDVVVALREIGLDWNAKADATIEECPREGVSLLHLAAVLEDDSVLEYLLEGNLAEDVNGVTDFNETALFMAAWQGQPRNVALLLSRNGDPEVEEKTGWSPVHIAARFGHISVISEFINYGCNLNIANSEGLDSEMIAWKYGHTELAQMIGRNNREHGTISPHALSCL